MRVDPRAKERMDFGAVIAVDGFYLQIEFAKH